MRIVLASESKFRRRAMELVGLPYETCPAGINEKAIRDDDPVQLTRKLAEAKARHVGRLFSNALVVAGDAVAAKGGKIFEKPRDNAEAIQFLTEFSGGEFQFVTSLAVLHTHTGRMLSTAEICRITFRRLTEREIQNYISSYPVLNYAGAFESDAVHRFAEKIEGSYTIGTALPVSRLIVFLREQGVDV